MNADDSLWQPLKGNAERRRKRFRICTTRGCVQYKERSGTNTEKRSNDKRALLQLFVLM